MDCSRFALLCVRYMPFVCHFSGLPGSKLPLSAILDVRFCCLWDCLHWGSHITYAVNDGERCNMVRQASPGSQYQQNLGDQQRWTMLHTSSKSENMNASYISIISTNLYNHLCIFKQLWLGFCKTEFNRSESLWPLTSGHQNLISSSLSPKESRGKFKEI